MKNSDIRINFRVIRLCTALLLFGAALGFKIWPNARIALFILSYIISGGEVLYKAVNNIIRGKVFNEYFLMSIATIGAFALGEFAEGVAVMLFFQAGMHLEHLAVNRSRKSIADLMDIRPEYANLKMVDSIKKLPPEYINVGDTIIVKPGEKVPLDGIVLEGDSVMDTSALTGESAPKVVDAGSQVLSGFINKTGLLKVKVTKRYKESTVSRILELVENAGSRKASADRFITKFARYYTPAVVSAALILAFIPPFVLGDGDFNSWFYRSLVFLVISCPCALVISIPLSFFGGIGGASRNGILIKGSNYLDALNNVHTVVFDKTGTLTKGVFEVSEIRPEKGITEEWLLEYAAYAEWYSNHPVGRPIIEAYGKKGNEIETNHIDNYDEMPGYGVKAKVKGKMALAGNLRLMNKENICCHVTDNETTRVYIAVDNEFAGYISISDQIKDTSAEAVKLLRKNGVEKVVVLSGDVKSISQRVADELNVDEVYAELLPHEKVEKLEMLEKQISGNGKVIYVGDGINDAPVMARADVSVAMGGLGSDAAIEAADIVLMTDEPIKLVTAIKIAGKTRSIVLQNIIFSLGVKTFIMALGAAGIASLWEAVFADVGVTLIVIINAMRAMKVKEL